MTTTSQEEQKPAYRPAGGYLSIWMLVRFCVSRSILIASALFLIASCSRQVEHQATKTAPAVRITQFYTNRPVLPKGEKALLCYGVDGAKSVRLDPGARQLGVALSRCIEVEPKETTQYTLTADDGSGQPVSQTVEVKIGGALPKFTDLSISSRSVKPGQTVSFCFKSQNAVLAEGSQGKFFKSHAQATKQSSDCLMDAPKRTTTYTITIRNAQGSSDEATMTVDVK